MLGNEYLTRAAPWTTIKQDKAAAAVSVRTGLNLVRLFAALSWPIIPFAAQKDRSAIGKAPDILPWPDKKMAEGSGGVAARQPVTPPDLLFAKIEDEKIKEWKARFGGAEN